MGEQFGEGAEGWGHEGEEKREGGGGTRGLCFGKNRSLGAGVENPTGSRGHAVGAALVPAGGLRAEKRRVDVFW